MSWLVFFLFFPHVKPPAVEDLWPAAGALYNVGRIFSAFIIVVLFLGKKRLPSKPVWIIGALECWILLTTWINGAPLRTPLIQGLSIVAVSLLVDFFSRYPGHLLKGLLGNFELLLYANLLTILFYFPEGMYRSVQSNYPMYWLGFRNDQILYVLVTVLLALLCAGMGKDKGRCFAAAAAGCLAIGILWSATAVMALLIVGLVLLLGKTTYAGVVNLRRVFIVALAADVLISVFRVMDRVMWMAVFIEAFLRRQVTLTGRTYIWDAFYSLFFASPWIGYGEGQKFHTQYGFLASHAHNQWFQLLLVGGVVALGLFFLLNLLVVKKVMRYAGTPAARAFTAVFAGLYVLFIAETYTNVCLYMLYILAYHIDKFLTPRDWAAIEPRGPEGFCQS